jgi:hypothetical protein
VSQAKLNVGLIEKRADLQAGDDVDNHLFHVKSFTLDQFVTSGGQGTKRDNGEATRGKNGENGENGATSTSYESVIKYALPTSKHL